MLTFKYSTKISLPISYVIVCLPLIFTNSAWASSTQVIEKVRLEVSPERCIALHKGQTCYLNTTFTWASKIPKDYCLIDITQDKEMQCWHQAENGVYTFDFQATQSHDFVLRDKFTKQEYARTRINVAWVYKSSKRSKSSWRLF